MLSQNPLLASLLAKIQNHKTETAKKPAKIIPASLTSKPTIPTPTLKAEKPAVKKTTPSKPLKLEKQSSLFICPSCKLTPRD